MSTNRDRRIEKLEQRRRPKTKIIYAWRDVSRQSVNQAIKQQCPKGVPANARLVICSWQSEDDPRR